MSCLTAQRHTELLELHLAGESVDTSRFGYEFGAHHLGVIVAGPQAEALIGGVATTTARRLLLLGGNRDTLSGWWGGRRRFDEDELEEIRRLAVAYDGLVAIGEPAEGISGWRLTHRQAQAALAHADRGPWAFARYGDVALLAAVSADEDLSAFLVERFLAHLEAGRDGGEVLLTTIRAYLRTGCDSAATALSLGLPRRTIADRLAAIEDRIGRPIAGCLAELDLALRLQVLTGRPSNAQPVPATAE